MKTRNTTRVSVLLVCITAMLMATSAIAPCAFGATMPPTRQYTYMTSQGFDLSSVPDSLEVEGVEYPLVSTSAVKDTTYVPDEQQLKEQLEATSGVDDLERVKASLPLTLDAASYLSGYTGKLKQDSLLATPIYKAYERQVDKTVEVKDLPDNDVARIALTYECATTVANTDTGKDTAKTVTLNRSDIHYQVSIADVYGMPVSYTATVTYRGTETYSAVAGYNITATYTGTATSTETRMILTASYGQPSLFNWLPWLLTALGVAAVGGGGLAAIIIWRRHFLTIRRSVGAREITLIRIKMNKDSKGLVAFAPSEIDFTLTGIYGVVSARWVKTATHLSILQDTKIIYDGLAATIIPLSYTASSVEGSDTGE